MAVRERAFFVETDAVSDFLHRIRQFFFVDLAMDFLQAVEHMQIGRIRYKFRTGIDLYHAGYVTRINRFDNPLELFAAGVFDQQICDDQVRAGQ